MFYIVLLFLSLTAFCIDDSCTETQPILTPKRDYRTGAILNFEELLQACSSQDKSLELFRLDQELDLIRRAQGAVRTRKPPKDNKPNFVIPKKTKRTLPPLDEVDRMLIDALDPDFDPENIEATEARLLTLLQDKLGAAAPESIDVLDAKEILVCFCNDNPFIGNEKAYNNVFIQNLHLPPGESPEGFFQKVMATQKKMWYEKQQEEELKEIESQKEIFLRVALAFQADDPDFNVQHYVDTQVDLFLEQKAQYAAEVLRISHLSVKERIAHIKKLRNSYVIEKAPAPSGPRRLSTKEYLAKLWKTPSFYAHRPRYYAEPTVAPGEISDSVDGDQPKYTHSELAIAMGVAANRSIVTSVYITKEELLQEFPFIPQLMDASRATPRSCLLTKFLFSLWEQFWDDETFVHTGLLQDVMRAMAPSCLKMPKLSAPITETDDLQLSFSSDKTILISNANAKKALQYFQCFSKTVFTWSTWSMSMTWLSTLRTFQKHCFAFKVFGLMLYLEDPQSPWISWKNHSLRNLHIKVSEYHAANLYKNPRAYPKKLDSLVEYMTRDQERIQKEHEFPQGSTPYTPPKISLALEKYALYHFTDFICSITQLPAFHNTPFGASEKFLKTAQDLPDSLSFNGFIVLPLDDLFE